MWLRWKSQIPSGTATNSKKNNLRWSGSRIAWILWCFGSSIWCLYLRSTASRSKYSVRLLYKSRVAPTKNLSLPRLKLCGAVLLAKLSKTVLKAVTIQIHNIYYWCDSTIVLSWIPQKKLHNGKRLWQIEWPKYNEKSKTHNGTMSSQKTILLICYLEK